MIQIVCGTNRTDSKSLIVAKLYQKLLSEKGQEAEILDLQDLPQDFMYTALYGNNGKNEAFNRFVDKMLAAQKYVFVIAEYNGSFPGVLKAFVDGMPYPNCFMDKKAALVGLSAGDQGGVLAMSHFTDILNYLGTNVLAQKIKLPFSNKMFADGELPDGLHLQLIKEQIGRFAGF